MEENQNFNPTQEPKKNTSKTFLIVIGLMAIVIVILVTYIVMSKKTSSNDETQNISKSTTSSNSEKKVKKEAIEEDDDEEEEEEENKTSSNKVSSKKEKNTNTESSSSFGKKNKNNTVETKTSNDSEGATLEGDWKSEEFAIEGVSYKLFDDYKKFTDNGWSVDFSKYQYDDGYILNKKDKTYSTIDLEKSEFDDSRVQIGFINVDGPAKDITECQVWAISVDNFLSDTPVDFSLPGGIKRGSTLEEVEAAYGKPEEDDIYRADSLKYTTYTYNNQSKPTLRLTIYDEGGLDGFQYQDYSR